MLAAAVKMFCSRKYCQEGKPYQSQTSYKMYYDVERNKSVIYSPLVSWKELLKILFIVQQITSTGWSEAYTETCDTALAGKQDVRLPFTYPNGKTTKIFMERNRNRRNLFYQTDIGHATSTSACIFQSFSKILDKSYLPQTFLGKRGISDWDSTCLLGNVVQLHFFSISYWLSGRFENFGYYDKEIRLVEHWRIWAGELTLCVSGPPIWRRNALQML